MSVKKKRSSAPAELTPMMRQYLEIKERNRDAILFFRLGDFYEMFFDDALEVTRLLHITLTSRDGGKGKKVPMCGVPHHAASNYIARLIKHGKKVAICEQVEDAAPGKKLVKRDITRIITPGTFIADEILDSSINNYILSLYPRDGKYGIAFADISTGEFRLTEVSDLESLLSELSKVNPSETLIPQSFPDDEGYKPVSDINLGTMTGSEDWHFDPALCRKELKNHFAVESLEGFGCEEMDTAVGAAGALMRYLKETQRSDLRNIGGMSSYNPGQYMALDRNSHRHLELVTNQEDLTSKNTLLDVLDRTRTPMGKRRLKRWILNPLVDPDGIRRRLDALDHFFGDAGSRRAVRELLADIYDIARLSNRISLGSANARDMVALSSSLKKVGELKERMTGELPLLLDEIRNGLDHLPSEADEIDRCIVDEPPVTVREGGLIRKGYSEEVDELKGLVSDGKEWVASLQRKEMERTGISSLKIGFNRVFGYYIEVTKTNLDNIPDDYVRKQTLANAERFITEELKEKEARIIGAQDRIKVLEYDIFRELRSKVALEIDRLKRTADLVSILDVICSFAEVAVHNNYVRPVVNRGDKLDIVEGRHPVLEKILKDKEFVPNDTRMDSASDRIFIITGSNMAGKSTYIRQTALMAIMAQMGSFVPASRAEIGVVDRVFTRVGASDRLYRGMSTFMVEMLETANILNNATNRSLIILDEIGRGTSTFDGVSIAWAVVEHINSALSGAKAMFATHYHELTELKEIMPGVRNYHLAIREWGEDIIFLYKVTEGSCDESFGIHVARLAGMPDSVVKRARDILQNLHKDSLRGNIRSRFGSGRDREGQRDLFSGPDREEPVIRALRETDIQNLTPLEALMELKRLKDTFASGGLEGGAERTL